MAETVHLYEIASDYEQVAEMIDNPDYDQETVIGTLEAIQGEGEEKLKNCVAMAKNIKSSIAQIDEAIKALQARKKSFSGRKDWLDEYMRSNMKKLNIKKVADPINPIRESKNGGKLPLVLDDPEKIPAEYYYIPEPEVDNDKLRQALEKGESVPGAHLGERGTHLVY